MLELDYVGPRYSLFRKNQPNFPLSGLLLANPACWKPSMLQSLQAEQVLAYELLPSYSPLLPFLDSVVTYTQASDKVQYLNGLPEDEELTDYLLRFRGNQALSEGLYSLAIEQFSQIEIWVFKDYLATALANIQLKKLAKAEHVLSRGTEISWPSMKFTDLEILYRLLDQIQQSGLLSLIDQGYLDRLGVQVGMAMGSTPVSATEPSLFCPATTPAIAGS